MNEMLRTMEKDENAAEKSQRDLTGLEDCFQEVVIKSGVVYVTVNGSVKKVKKELVDRYGPRKNVRLNVEKTAKDLILRRLREMFNLKGKHLAVKFLEFVNGKLADEHGNEIIRYTPSH